MVGRGRRGVLSPRSPPRPASLVVADFGCGDCKIASSIRNKVHSFDLVPLSPLVTVCDMAKVGGPGGTRRGRGEGQQLCRGGRRYVGNTCSVPTRVLVGAGGVGCALPGRLQGHRLGWRLWGGQERVVRDPEGAVCKREHVSVWKTGAPPSAGSLEKMLG